MGMASKGMILSLSYSETIDFSRHNLTSITNPFGLIIYTKVIVIVSEKNVH